MITCIINQPAGLGDILFTIKIAVRILEDKKADAVIWPVSRYYGYISEYIQIAGVTFVSEEDSYIGKEEIQKNIHGIYYHDNLLIVNLRRADEVVELRDSNKPMYCKYELVGIRDFEDWYRYVNLKRNIEREKYLENMVCKVDGKFNLINRTFATYPDIQVADICVTSSDIEVVNTGFDRIFDWCGLIEKCEEFHTVETSFCYIAKLIGKDNVFVYPRKTKTDFAYIKKIFPDTWKYLS